MNRRHQDPAPQGDDHGLHTLRVWHGMVVGINGDDVFVEFGPRLQGVVSRKQFEEGPACGEEYDFTALGQEDGLWALARVEEGSLDSWETMECGSWVQARATGRNPGGLDLKIGPLHAFMPKSETGLPRGKDPKVLVGKTITCEVIEIDRERQRVFVSRKAVVQKQRESSTQREVGSLKPGQVIHGRVSRIESYGAFVRFGQGVEGLIHISNISRERVEHPGDVLRKGQSVEAEILTVRQGGKRVGLGIKQLQENPWKRLIRTHYVDQITLGQVTRLTEFGAFVSIAKGIEGLLHESESGLAADRRLREFLKPGQSVPVRILSLDIDEERMSLSRLHRNGALVQEEDVLEPGQLEELRDDREEDDGSVPSHGMGNLGNLLRRALEPGGDSGSNERAG